MCWRAALPGLILLAATGCLNDRPARSTSLLDRVRGMGGPSGPDAVFIEYALVERPAGSAAINREVWANIDEQVLDTEKRALLGENGLRVGVVGGLLPSEIETMIANPKSAIGHRQRRLYVNNPASLAIHGPVPQTEFRVLTALGGEPTTAKHEQARFALSITPTHSADGRLTLKCAPEIEHQDKKSWLPTGAAGPGWLNGRPAERFDTLGWEVTLSPREFLVIGAHYERGNWLGNQLFTAANDREKSQYLLIIRAGRLGASEGGTELLPPAPNRDGFAPIASQASVTAARGQRP